MIEGSQIGVAGQAKQDEPGEIEKMTKMARDLCGQANAHASRLTDLRDRLLGAEPEVGTEAEQLAEPVRVGVDQLGAALRDLRVLQEAITARITSLERL